MHLAITNNSVLYGAPAPAGFGRSPTGLIQPCRQPAWNNKHSDHLSGNLGKHGKLTNSKSCGDMFTNWPSQYAGEVDIGEQCTSGIRDRGLTNCKHWRIQTDNSEMWNQLHKHYPKQKLSNTCTQAMLCEWLLKILQVSIFQIDIFSS